MRRIAFVMGTRPEVIKLAPVILRLRRSSLLEPCIVFSGQHDTMAAQAFRAFSLEPDIDLGLMTREQTPNSFLGLLLQQLEPVLADLRPACCMVQGDTTSALGGALTAFHLQLPIAHLEAGLRTHRFDSPFPEEMNRSVISKISSAHFCPTAGARQNLEREGITRGVYVVGNTVVDAAIMIRDRLQEGEIRLDPALGRLRGSDKRLILVTGHRRENFDQPLENLCDVLLRLRDTLPDIQIVYPVHLNPRVGDIVHRRLSSQPRISLIPPVDYPSLLWAMAQSELIISDSGGIQEEAPCFGVRVLVTRSTTERPEALESGCALLTTLDNPQALFDTAMAELAAKQKNVPHDFNNPFGDGNTAERVAGLLEELWG